MKKSKRIILALGLFLLLVISAGLLVRYFVYLDDKDPHKTFLQPRIDGVEMLFDELNNNKFKMTLRLLVKNPMPIDLLADSVTYKLFVGATEIAESTQPKKWTLKKGDSTWQEIPMIVYKHRLDSQLNKLSNNRIDSVEYVIRSVIYTRMKKFHLNRVRRAPVFHFPELKVESIHIDSLNRKRVLLNLTFIFINENVFDINVVDLEYRLLLENGKWSKGFRPDTLHLPAKRSTNFNLFLKVPLEGVPKTLWTILTHGRGVHYDIIVSFKFPAGKNNIRDCRVTFRDKGDLRSAMEMKKK